MLDVLIFDEDPVFGALLQDVLGEDGLSAERVSVGGRADRAVRERRPRAVILGTLPPGEDPFVLCRALTSSPDAGEAKIVILSARSSRSDRERAFASGASLFFRKPLVIPEFRESMRALVRKPRMRPDPRPAVGGAPQAALTVLSGQGACFFRAGPAKVLMVPESGLEGAELDLMAEAGGGVLWVLLPRPLPRVAAAVLAEPRLKAPGRELQLAGPSGTLRGPADAKSSFFLLREGSFNLGPEVKLAVIRIPGFEAALGFRVEAAGRSIVFCPDGRLRPPRDHRPAAGAGWPGFFRNADVLIHGAGDGADPPGPRAAALLEQAAEAGVKTLILTGLPPGEPPPEPRSTRPLRCEAARPGRGYVLAA